MFRVREQVGCPKESGENSQGSPVTIAFLDTGIIKHPDFEDRIIGFKDFVNGRKEAYDDAGHGTHVCGIAAGNGLLSNGKYRGIAPESNILMGKVLDGNGDGEAANMLKGLEWVIQNRVKYHIRILNISIGIGSLKDEKKKRELISRVEEAWRSGMIVVCAAGNLGPKRASISPLGISNLVITVGCHDGDYFPDKQNRCETYSGRGPTEFAIKKPDIVAPGTEIISCCNLCKKNDKGYENAYFSKSGTSMATPQVSGAAALLLQKNPVLKNETVKKKLLYAATDLNEPWTKQGWGMLNIKRMLE